MAGTSDNIHVKGSGEASAKEPFRMEFDVSTIKHLGLQMYSTLPPVVGELVSNAWDADAQSVDITIPTTVLTDDSEIVVTDDGSGMSDADIRTAYLIVGRDRRREDGMQVTPIHQRPIMGRKGIGKFSAFGIARQIEIETVKKREVSRFIMDYDEMKNAQDRQITMPPLGATNTVTLGTKVTLRRIQKFRTQKVNIQALRRGLARRFSVIGPKHRFAVRINGNEISPTERDLKRLLDKDADGNPYLWEYDKEEIKPGTGWTVSGWIGALDRTNQLEDGIQRGIVIMARGKLVQEPFVFDATVGQQYALSYLVGELHAEFVDQEEDSIGTTRNSLVWDTEANAAFKEWGQKEVNRIAREWAEKRKLDNERELQMNPLYQDFVQKADQFDNKRIKRVADRFVKEIVGQNVLGDKQAQEKVIDFCLDFMEFDAFQEFAEEVARTDTTDIPSLLDLFREWEVVEAKEMMRVTEGRITTIEKLESLIESNALEVPTLHNFLKEFPWVLDPRWNLIADEKRYSKLLREQFPEKENVPIEDRRIDFLCVRESTTLVVVEIKRPSNKASKKELDQIEEYVIFMRDHVQKTTDPDLRSREVVGYLLTGDLVDTAQVRGRRANLEKTQIYVRLYDDLLRLVEASHREFLKRYERLVKARRTRSA